MIDREQIIASFPLTTHLQNIGVKIRGEGTERTATRCPQTQHKDRHWCVTVNPLKQIFYCNDCKVGGSIIDWLAIEQNRPATEVLKDLAGKIGGTEETKPQSQAKAQIVATYDYTDEKGELLYQVLRMEPKSFRQRQPDDNGGWKWTMEGATRVLFNLPKVLMSPMVIVCEGEKDCLNLEKLGFVATCNVAGAGKWLDAYSDSLKGRDVVIIPDNDKPGQDHAKKVADSLYGKANSIKTVVLPDPHKDASDFIASFKDPEEAAKALTRLIERTPHTVEPLPVFSIQEMEARYIHHVTFLDARSFDLSKFLPSLKGKCRPLIPGEVAVVMANTGVGKTAIMQSMARHTAPLSTLFFELELPLEMMFERWVQMEVGCLGRDVEAEYKGSKPGLWKAYKGLNHVLICPSSGLTTDQIEDYINRSELKFGQKPVVVFVDYIGLVKSRASRGRYEGVSQAAEDLKVIAKRTETIIIVGTQVSRNKNAETLEVGLYDAKDSGSIENSAGLVLGCWRPSPERINIKILKNTKGFSGDVIECSFDGAKMQIQDIGRISAADIPKHSKGNSPYKN